MVIKRLQTQLGKLHYELTSYKVCACLKVAHSFVSYMYLTLRDHCMVIMQATFFGQNAASWSKPKRAFSGIFFCGRNSRIKQYDLFDIQHTPNTVSDGSVSDNCHQLIDQVLRQRIKYISYIPGDYAGANDIITNLPKHTNPGIEHSVI